MSDMLIKLAADHSQFLYGLLGGFAMGHLDDLVAYGFHALMMIPTVRAWIVANPVKAKQIVDAIAKDLDQDIDNAATPKA
jgi:hypothetical protein